MLKRFVMEKDKDKGGGGGGGNDDDKKTPATVSREEFDELKSAHAELMKQLKTKNKSRDRDDDDSDEDEDLRARARKSAKKNDQSKSDTVALEAAIRFNMGAADFLKNNASLLPKEVADIFKQAEAEKYESPIQKDAAIKSGIIQSFFAVQANLDLLTAGVKPLLEDFLKLTKDGKQAKAREIYDTVFEPSFEMLRRVKKAEALSAGDDKTDTEKAYANRLMKGSKKHYLGEKSDS